MPAAIRGVQAGSRSQLSIARLPPLVAQPDGRDQREHAEAEWFVGFARRDAHPGDGEVEAAGRHVPCGDGERDDTEEQESQLELFRGR